MTTMHQGGTGDFSYDNRPFEQRTSVLAIVSLVLSLLGVCIPGFGLLGLLFGVISIFLISGSAGRLSGRGLSASGIVIGLLTTVIWLAIIAGMSKVISVFGSSIFVPADNTMKAIEAGDWKKARAEFTSSTADKLTDADFVAFRTAYQAEMGAYKSGPTGFIDFALQMGEVGPAMNRFQNNPNNLIPVPMTFEKGKAVVALQVTPPAQTGSTSGAILIPISNLQLVTLSGKTITLYDPDNRPLPSGEASTPEASPKTPAEPAPAK